MDSDFDYLFNGNFTEQSRLVNELARGCSTPTPMRPRTSCATRPSLHRVCAKATKNDTLIFDFEKPS